MRTNNTKPAGRKKLPWLVAGLLTLQSDLLASSGTLATENTGIIEPGRAQWAVEPVRTRAVRGHNVLVTSLIGFSVMEYYWSF